MIEGRLKTISTQFLLPPYPVWAQRRMKILKNELVYHRRYATREQAISEIIEYIEIFYNRQRRQKRLGYLSPTVYEQLFYERKKAA